MNASKPITGLFALALALGSVGIGSARAQSDQDHAAHHSDAAQTQTAPATAPGMPMQQGGAMPGMMGGNMQPMMRMMQEMHGRMAQQEMGTQMGMMRPEHIEGRIAFRKQNSVSPTPSSRSGTPLPTPCAPRLAKCGQCTSR
jgi:hypothetical protein